MTIPAIMLLACTPAWGWTTPAPVGATSQDSLDPRLAVDADGKAHLVWRERVGGTTFQIWCTSNAAGTFVPPVQISQGGSVHCYSPVVAVDQGNIHVAWASDQSGSNFEIWYRENSAGTWGTIFNASNTAIKSLRPAITARGGPATGANWQVRNGKDLRDETPHQAS